jgi:hypothetical protein
VALTLSSPQLLERLGAEMDVRAPDYALWQDYYDGRHQPPVALLAASSGYRSEYARWLSGFSDNFCRLVISAVDERLAVTGFRVDGKAGDRKAWGYWQENQLDAWHLRAHREALVKSWCPVTVDAAPDGSPRIRAHEADQFAIAWDDDDALERAAAMRRWATPDGRRLATLYFADRVEKYELGLGNAWQRRAVAGEPWPLPHSLGVVPVVPIVNDPDLYNRGQSEIAAVLPMQNALNLLMSDMLVSAEYTAYPQRWVTGLEIPVDPDTGKPIQPFKLAYDRMLMARDPNVKFGQLDAADLQPYIRAVEACIQHIASTTRTPPHYLLGQSGAFPSGESLKATETGLVAKVRRRQGDFGESWEECIGLAFAAAGDAKRAGIEDKEAVWKDPEVRTEAQHVDALLKLKALGIPLEQLWEDAGYSPQLIQKWKDAAAAAAAAGGMPVDPSAAGDPEAMAAIRGAVAPVQAEGDAATTPAAPRPGASGAPCPCCAGGSATADCCAPGGTGDCPDTCTGGACCPNGHLDN